MLALGLIGVALLAGAVWASRGTQPQAGSERTEATEGQGPVVTIVTRDESLQRPARSYCWPTGEIPNPVCVDSPFVPNPDRSLSVRPGERLAVRLPNRAVQPQRVRLQVWLPLPDGADVRTTPHGEGVEDRLLAASGSPEWPVRQRPGRYVASIGAYWEDRNAAWAFGIEVVDPSSTAGRDEEPSRALPAAVAAAILVGAASLFVLRRRLVRTKPDASG